MRALVAGATGFIGSHVTRRLVEAGHEVRVLLRAGSDRARLGDLPVEVHVGDLLDAGAVAKAAEGCDWVFSAAGRVSFWRGDARELWAQHFTGTENLIEACVRSGARLVYTSSEATLGTPAPGSAGDECTPFDGDPRRYPYAGAKRAAEQAIADAVERRGLDAVILLPTVTLGPGDVNLSATRFIAELAQGRILACPPGGVTVAPVGAVAAAYLAAAERGVKGERYLLGGDHLTYREFFACIARELGRRPPRLPLPRAMLRVLGAAGGLASDLTRRDLGLNDVTSRLACAKRYYTSEKAARELGYRPGPAQAAIAEACRWYRSTLGREQAR